MQNIIKIRKELLEKNIAGNFERIAREVSEFGSCQDGGDLGTFGRGDMVPSFEEAAFKLKVGELREPAFSESGIHLILRSA